LAAILPMPVLANEVDGARLTWRHLRLGTDIADAAQRLAAIRAQADVVPDPVARLLGNRDLAELGEQASAALLAWSRRWVRRAGARLGSRTPPANCTITEVPAPDQPLFLCGARMTYYSAILPISDGLGLAYAITRYDGRVVISPTSCRELMPDPEVFALCLRDSFQEYLALARSPRRRSVGQRRSTGAARVSRH
jgi:hypothetical protein